VAARADSDSRTLDDAADVNVLGIPVRAASAGAVETEIRGYLSDPWDGKCRQVATVNPEYVMAARSDAEFAAALRTTDLNTIDGIGVLLAAKTISPRARRAERLSGVQLTESLARTSAHDNAPIFLLGAGPGVADAATVVLRSQWPDALFAGSWSAGRPDPADDAAALERIAASGARTLFVAYGATGQVAFIERNRDQLARAGVRLAIGIGGTLDMISGRAPRAPRVVRQFGMEWLFRLIVEPWRWRRQLALPRFVALVVWHRFTGRT
jgi:N-acetylglucosaminyldiphosphoundecaprenol N-acetyl-beta-D-mannosaminyltransferase